MFGHQQYLVKISEIQRLLKAKWIIAKFTYDVDCFTFALKSPSGLKTVGMSGVLNTTFSPLSLDRRRPGEDCRYRGYDQCSTDELWMLNNQSG